MKASAALAAIFHHSHDVEVTELAPEDGDEILADLRRRRVILLESWPLVIHATADFDIATNGGSQ